MRLMVPIVLPDSPPERAGTGGGGGQEVPIWRGHDQTATVSPLTLARAHELVGARLGKRLIVVAAVPPFERSGL